MGPVAGWRGTGGQGTQPCQYSTPPQDQGDGQHCVYVCGSGGCDYVYLSLKYKTRQDTNNMQIALKCYLWLLASFGS